MGKDGHKETPHADKREKPTDGQDDRAADAEEPLRTIVSRRFDFIHNGVT